MNEQQFLFPFSLGQKGLGNILFEKRKRQTSGFIHRAPTWIKWSLWEGMRNAYHLHHSVNHFHIHFLPYFLQQTVTRGRPIYCPHFHILGNWDAEVKWLAQSQKSLKRTVIFWLQILCLWSILSASQFRFLHINMHVVHLLPWRRVHLHQHLKSVPETCFY